MFLQNKYTKWYNSIIEKSMSRTLTGYVEIHHIKPRALGGNNSKSNLARLTAREHFVCHLLLPKMVTGTDRRNMVFAIWSMLNRDHSKSKSRYKINSHFYGILKRQIASATSALHKGKTVSDATRKKMSDKAKGRTSPNKGKPMSENQKQKLRNTIAKNGRSISPETVRKILESRKDYRHSDETKAKISASSTRHMLGKSLSDETKAKISAANTGRAGANKGKPAPNRGIPHSKETIAKFKEAHKNREYIPCPHCGKSIAKCSFGRWHGDNCKLAP